MHNCAVTLNLKPVKCFIHYTHTGSIRDQTFGEFKINCDVRVPSPGQTVQQLSNVVIILYHQRSQLQSVHIYCSF